MKLLRKNNRQARHFATMLILMVVLAVSGLPFADTRAAAPVNAISYQGRLLNSNGVPVSDASLEFVFRFLDSASGGTCLWESDDGAACDDPDETQTVALTDGLFSENIGSSVDPTGLSEAYPVDLTDIFGDNTNVYLEVVVDGETLSPRKQIVATPYALNAQSLDGLDSTDLLAAAGDTATGDYDYTGAILLGGSPLVFEGTTPDDFETTFAFTDPTADRTITFQNADGTVAFLSDISGGASLWETGTFGTFENDDNVLIGTDSDETIASTGFSLSGNDLFVSGDIGIEGSLYTDSGIVGGAVGIGFSEFDVSATTGSITINDGGDLGQVSVEGSVLDIDSLTFVGSGSIGVSGIGSDLTLNPSDQVIIDGGAQSVDIRDQLLNSTGDVVIADQFSPDSDNARSLGASGLGWSAIWLRNIDDGVSVSLSSDGTGETNSGASVIGVFDEFATSAGGNVQDTLDDFDQALATGGTGSMWTLASGVVYPTTATSDFVIGGTTASASPFGVDESANTVYIGEGSVGNGTLTFKASDADTGSIAFSTNDRWEFTGGDVFIGSTTLGSVKSTFVPDGDDLYVAGDIAAQSSMYADTFVAGDASTTFADGSISTTSQNFSTNISVGGIDAVTHSMSFQIDGNDGMSIVATGDGAGGVGARTVSLGVSAAADVVAIGDANADVSIYDAQWFISSTGSAEFSSLAMDGNLDMQNFLLLDIGHEDTNFTAGGGLTLAGTLTANGTAQFNSDVDMTINGTENVVIGNGTGTGSNSVDLFAVNIINTDAAANTQRGIVVTNQASSTSATESLITVDNADALALTAGLTVSGSGGVVTNAIDVSNANIVNALSVGDNTILGTTALVDFTDFDVSADGLITIAPDAGGVGFTISPSAPMTAGIDFANTNVSVELMLQYDETISNQTDDVVSFNGAGGADNTDLIINLDGPKPTLSSNSDALIGFADSLEIDPASGNASIAFYASDADTGTLTYDTNDTFSFSGGNIQHSGLDSLPTTLSGTTSAMSSSVTYTGTSAVNLNSITIADSTFSVINQAVEGGGVPATTHLVYGVSAEATNSGTTGQAENVIGLRAQGRNSSTSANAVDGYVAGVEGVGLQNAAATNILDLRGVSGSVSVANGTVTDLFAIRGVVEAGAGGATTSYGGYFDNNDEGTTRYGILASASGGTANYAGYFHSAAVNVEENSTPSSPGFATDAGDLYVDSQLEIDGQGVTTSSIMDINSGTLTSGIALSIERSTSVSDFTNTTTGLVDFTITDTGSSGTVLNIDNAGTGSSLVVDQDADTGSTVSDTAGGAIHVTNTGNADFGLTVYSNNSITSNSLAYFFNDNAGFDNYVVDIRSDATTAGSANGTALHILQNQVDNPTADATGTQALIIDTNENFGAADGLLSDAMILVREDIGGTSDTVFRVDGDGDVWADGTLGAGASDVAELYPSMDTLVPGELVVMDPSGTGVLRSTEPYQGALLGGVSTLPGVLLGFEDGGYKIALAGRIPMFVTDENGPIVAGDPVTSSSTAGYGMKATEPGTIVGFALEGFAGPGSGSVSVFVSPQFYMGSVISTDGSVTQIEDDVELTGSLSVLGSGGSVTEQMSFVTDVTDATDYRLSIKNADGTQVAYVSNGGDLALSGRFYPSDRGALQTSKYIYYDGSSGMGGDFMRTNASGWATGSYDFAEMFPSADKLTAGDVVAFGSTNESVALTQKASDAKLAGIVSTRPGFLAGENLKGSYPIALAGRVPTKVSNENGTIEIGDPLTSSTRAGYAMKATKAGPIIGYALEPYSGSGNDKIIAYVNVSYWNGGETPALPGTSNIASKIVVTQNANNLTALNMNGNVYMTGNDILGVRRLAGISGRWSIEEDGTVRTPGTLKTVTESYQGDAVETMAVTSPDVQITLVGTSTLENGEAVIRFEQVSPTFNDVTSTISPIRVIVTPNGPVSLYVFEKDNDGFGVRQVNGHDSGVTFDWIVSAYRKGYEPEEAQPTDDEPVTEEDPVAEEPVIETPSDAELTETDPPSDEVLASPVEEEAPETVIEIQPDPEPVVTDEQASPESPEPTPDDSMESTVVEEPAP
ncbi:hypothetical protein A2501_05085 [Candidatus Uhrbacteria bacterium RIFOXYC12_FULL_57_11]|nr:MAG: hypothetical protein A2501_05085 [Candidatus Uhrbacteria bacterium RIFOXYC12_FULL_57_11]